MSLLSSSALPGCCWERMLVLSSLIRAGSAGGNGRACSVPPSAIGKHLLQGRLHHTLPGGGGGDAAKAKGLLEHDGADDGAEDQAAFAQSGERCQGQHLRRCEER